MDKDEKRAGRESGKAEREEKLKERGRAERERGETVKGRGRATYYGEGSQERASECRRCEVCKYYAGT